MFILFGFRRKSARLGTLFVMCGYCHTPAAHALTRIRRYFTLFFVPVIPLGAKYVTTCTMCGRSTQITKETAETYAAAANQDPAASGGPATPAPSAQVNTMARTEVASSPAQSSTAFPTLPTENEGRVIYCSWCGKERAVNAQALHHCGSKERPAVFCMTCGTTLEEGAPNCTFCGTPATQISR
jgi:hypothetical protein